MKLLQLQKRCMAMAGLVMTVYLIFHMLTNLTYFFEPAFTEFYAVYNQAWIRWPILIVVLASLFIHVRAAVAIRKKNSQARLVGYQKHHKLHIPAPLVTISVGLLLIFILVHIGQTLALDVNIIRDELQYWFSSILLVLFYLSGLFILAMHLSHSLINVLQTLGISSKTYQWLIWTAIGILMTGFASVPVYIWMTA